MTHLPVVTESTVDEFWAGLEMVPGYYPGLAQWLETIKTENSVLYKEAFGGIEDLVPQSCQEDVTAMIAKVYILLKMQTIADKPFV